MASAAQQGEGCVVSRVKLYQTATRSFINWLGRTAPPAPGSAAGILACAQRCVQIFTTGVPAHVLGDLKTSIRLRKEVHFMLVSRAVEECDSDRSHRHFIDVLRETQNILKSAEQRQPSAEPAAARLHEVTHVPNQFAALPVEVLPSSAADAPTDAAASSAATPVAAQAIDLSDIDLFGKSASFVAACIILDLQECLDQITSAWREVREGSLSVLAASAVTNACIARVTSVISEAELMHPHLASLERLIAAAHLSGAVDSTAAALGVPWKAALELCAMVAFGDAAGCKGCTMRNRMGGRLPAIFAVRLYLEDPEDEAARDAWKSAVEMVCAWARVTKLSPPMTKSRAIATIRTIINCASARFLCVDLAEPQQVAPLAHACPHLPAPAHTSDRPDS